MAATIRLTVRNRVGLVLTGLIGLSSVLSVFGPSVSPGEAGPPGQILVFDSAFGLVTVVAVIFGWRGNGRAIRLAAAALILQLLTTLPGFFVDIPPALKVLTTAVVVLSIVAVVLMLAPPRIAKPTAE
jgi:hypothetical protein